MRTLAYRPTNLIGPQVRKFRIQRGLSQNALAVKCQLTGWNLSRQALAKIESKIRSVTDYEVIGLAAALEVPFELLFPARSSLQKGFKQWVDLKGYKE